MSIFNDNKGFFQGGKSFGGRGLFGKEGVLSGALNKMKARPCEGIAGVCPYTCKPLRTPEEQQAGVSKEVMQNPQIASNNLQAPQIFPSQNQNTNLMGGI